MSKIYWLSFGAVHAKRSTVSVDDVKSYRSNKASSALSFMTLYQNFSLVVILSATSYVAMYFFV
ncbi:hypothetical protein BGZ82_011083 [Podila clonocystis]|nr:hypothetical protein BGZ82_011083 [Podila clonocystis]